MEHERERTRSDTWTLDWKLAFPVFSILLLGFSLSLTGGAPVSIGLGVVSGIVLSVATWNDPFEGVATAWWNTQGDGVIFLTVLACVLVFVVVALLVFELVRSVGLESQSLQSLLFGFTLVVTTTQLFDR